MSEENYSNNNVLESIITSGFKIKNTQEEPASLNTQVPEDHVANTWFNQFKR